MAKKKKKKQTRARAAATGLGGIMAEIEEQLEKCHTDRFLNTGYQVPNYVKFKTWLYEKLEQAEEPGDAGRDTVTPVYKDIDMPLNVKYIQSLIFLKMKYDDELKKQAKPSQKTYNKMKLLFSAIDGMGPRARAFLEAGMKETGFSGELDEGLDECSPAQLRMRFFTAMRTKKEHIAFKILGKMKESDHDEGELAYLEALCCFNGNNFREAIRYAGKLKPGQVDYRSARAMILESHALMGDIDSLAEALNETGQVKISGFFFLYLIQTAVMNSANVEESSPKADEILDGLGGDALEADKSSLPLFNRYTCQLAVEYVERIQEKELQLLAYEQSGSTGNEELAFEDLMDDRDRKLSFALAFNLDLFEKLIAGEEPAPLILQYLLTPAYELDADDFYTAFMALYRLQKKREFVEHVIRYEKVVASFSDERNWELFELAYVEAISLGHPRARVLEKRLKDRPGFDSEEKRFEEMALTNKWLARLSPMGKLSYGNSEAMYERSRQEGYSWKDAGMISLGYFRILEVEINEKFIKPLSRSIPYEVLDEEIRKLKEGSSSKKTSELAAFWEGIAGNLKKIKAGTKNGLELGPLNFLLGKVRNTAGPDGEIKRIILEHMQESLTSEGREALASGRMADLIHSGARDRFRNPPAHTKFVTLKVAGECRDYVRSALALFDGWYK